MLDRHFPQSACKICFYQILFSSFPENKMRDCEKIKPGKIRYVCQLKDYSQPRTHLRNKSLLNWLSQVLYDTYIISDAMKFMTLIVGGKSRWTYFIYIRGDHLPFFLLFVPFWRANSKRSAPFVYFIWNPFRRSQRHKNCICTAFEMRPMNIWSR